jgi:hypothetical protein
MGIRSIQTRHSARAACRSRRERVEVQSILATGTDARRPCPSNWK